MDRSSDGLVEISNNLRDWKEHQRLTNKLYPNSSLQYPLSLCYRKVQLDAGFIFHLPVYPRSFLLALVHPIRRLSLRLIFCLRLEIVQIYFGVDIPSLDTRVESFKMFLIAGSI